MNNLELAAAHLGKAIHEMDSAVSLLDQAMAIRNGDDAIWNQLVALIRAKGAVFSVKSQIGRM